MLTNRQIFLRHLAQTSDIPPALEIVSASGCYMYDTEGKAYLDLISGISVSSLGHCHPKVTEAVKAQLDKYMHLMVYGEYVQSPQTSLAALLTSLLPASLDSVFLTNSGTEATEGAMKLAKRVTGRTEFVSFRNAYHGSTQGALSLAGDEWLKSAFRPLLPGVTQIQYNDFQDLSFITANTAAVFAEPLQAEAGCVLPQIGYLEALRKRCDETGALLVFDEIQTGMGRTCSLFAFSASGIVPDILLLGKAFGGGMPLAAFISSREKMRLLSHDPVLGHITTFGGHPVSCAAAFAVLNVLIENDYIAQVQAKENLFRELLIHPKIKAIHGKGLLLAVELGSFDLVLETIRKCMDKGLVTDWFLFNDQCIRIAPPLTITEKEIKEACEIILDAL